MKPTDDRITRVLAPTTPTTLAPSAATQLVAASPGAFGHTADEAYFPPDFSVESFALGGLLSTLLWWRAFARRRLTASAARRSNREFLTIISHEIRTPLTAILGFADLLRDDAGGTLAPAQRRQALDTIKQAGTHLLALINDTLDLSKVEANRLTTERADTPIVAVLREVQRLLDPLASGKGVTLETSLATPIPERILSDPTRLRQILINLVGNAIKFTESGCVRIVARAEAAHDAMRLIIDIEDTGSGISPDQARALFSPFSQADTTVTRKHGGTGLGLTLSDQLARIMGGSVVLLRSQPGLGSCFRLELPLETVPGSPAIGSISASGTDPVEQGARDPAADRARARLSGRILLAEDSPDTQRLIAFHLTRAGASVEIAHHGREALDMIDRAAAAGDPYDLLLTDMQMPEMDGYTLARTLRARASRMPVVALTAHALHDDRARCAESGCDDYATKPIDQAALVAVCRRWLTQHAAASPRANRPAA